MQSRKQWRALIAVVAAVGMLGGSAGSALANDPWNGWQAAQYADSHYDDCGIPYTMSPDGWYCYSADCTSFASRAMNEGGSYTMVNKGNGDAYADTWWEDKFTWMPNHSPSWAVGWSLYYFLVYKDHNNGSSGPGGGWLVHTNYGISFAEPHNYLYYGDLIFFASEGGGWWNIDHVKIETGWNTYYDWADQHSPGYWHTWWNGADHYPPNPGGYLLFQVHIDPANI